MYVLFTSDETRWRLGAKAPCCPKLTSKLTGTSTATLPRTPLHDNSTLFVYHRNLSSFTPIPPPAPLYSALLPLLPLTSATSLRPHPHPCCVARRYFFKGGSLWLQLTIMQSQKGSTLPHSVCNFSSNSTTYRRTSFPG